MTIPARPERSAHQRAKSKAVPPAESGDFAVSGEAAALACPRRGLIGLRRISGHLFVRHGKAGSQRYARIDSMG